MSATLVQPLSALRREAARFGVALGDEQIAQCERYAGLLIERNTSVNLTAITAPEDVGRKHFLDSFTALAARRWVGTERVVDVGAGAGFPGLALKIALPQLRLTLVESVGKKARFLEEVVATLGLHGVDVRNERAEDLPRELRGTFDVGLARALASLAANVEYILPLLRVGGHAIMWKGHYAAELPAAERALAAIGGSIVDTVATEALGVGELLPGRSLVVVRKTKPSPDRYPRRAVEARRRPW